MSLFISSVVSAINVQMNYLGGICYNDSICRCYFFVVHSVCSKQLIFSYFDIWCCMYRTVSVNADNAALFIFFFFRTHKLTFQWFFMHAFCVWIVFVIYFIVDIVWNFFDYAFKLLCFQCVLFSCISLLSWKLKKSRSLKSLKWVPNFDNSSSLMKDYVNIVLLRLWPQLFEK